MKAAYLIGKIESGVMKKHVEQQRMGAGASREAATLPEDAAMTSKKGAHSASILASSFYLENRRNCTIAEHGCDKSCQKHQP